MVLDFLKSYLNGRVQKVSINTTISETGKRLELGVLQGSILAGFLFLVYINDFYRCNDSLSIQFADDSTCLVRGKDTKKLFDDASAILAKIFNWFSLNKLALNLKKTNYMVFSLNDRIVDSFPPIKCNEQEICKVSKKSNMKTIRMLGIYLD